MPTARFDSSSISHGSAVIVAGGETHWNPRTRTDVVEVLHIIEQGRSYWSIVESLPYVVSEAVPLVINDDLYIAEGYDDTNGSICNIVTASLPELLQSNVKMTGSVRVWNELPDMPFSSRSINHYKGCLIIINGDRKVKESGKSKAFWKVFQLVHLYNPDTKAWDYVGDDFHDYKLGKSIHLAENKRTLFIGVMGGTLAGEKDEMVRTCSILTLTPK